MKKFNRYKLLTAVFALCTLTACDYEDINTNPFEMSDPEGKWDGVAIGGLVTAMEKSVFPTGTQGDDTPPVNEYQIAYNLSADAWSGYIGINNSFNSGNCHLNYFMVDAWVSSTFKNSYTNLLSSWQKLKDAAAKDNMPEVAALADILKISGWHKVLESFGPIPYTEAGKGNIYVPFDSEKTVYTAMLKELENAVNVLTEKALAGADVLPAFDLVYEGNATKWVKYANSLMLRLAVRLRTANDPELQQLSKQYAKLALEHRIGVMTDAQDAAGAGTGAGIVLRNPIWHIAEKYNDARVGTSILAYLLGYEDPRLSAYCLPADSKCSVAVEAFDGKKYQAVPMGHFITRVDDPNSAKSDSHYYYSKPNLKSETPLYWMRASEVYFLRAEAALFWGSEFGDAAALYEQGIATSFQEHGISDAVSDYMNSGNTPAANRVDKTSEQCAAFNYAAPCETTAEFTGSQEQKFEKIIIQKYIALYPNGQEAWTEFRRTGYPKLNPILPGGNRNSEIDPARGIRRMVYPVSFNGTGETQKIYQDALQKLGGADKPNVDLIWAKRN